MEREITLHAAGKEVPMNRFVKSVLLNVVEALLRSFDGFDANDELVIRLGKK